MQFELDRVKALEALVYVAARTPGHDLYKALKTLYVADKLHLARYGRFIYGETYAALPYGPVPQVAYDAARSTKEPWRYTTIPRQEVEAALRLDGVALRPQREADVMELSGSDVECLDQAIQHLQRDSMDQIKLKTHDSAWENTERCCHIDVLDIINALPEDRQDAVRAYLQI